MMYSVHVIETRTVEVYYHVEAENRAEAITKAEAGETEAETDFGILAVIDRQAIADEENW